ncbi:MAG TPA: iron-containing alcohol dehydrogenase, partial [Nakamurella sp.]
MVAIGYKEVIRTHTHANDPRSTPERTPTPVVKFHAPEIVFGLGALAEAGFAAGRLGARRPFVVSDDGVHDAGWVHALLIHLREAGLDPVVWRGVTPNPKD